MSAKSGVRSPALALAALALAACPARGPRGYAEPPADGATITDPVDGSSCLKTPASPSAVWEARTYYFCSAATATTFRKTPQKHADRGEPTA